MGVVRRLRARRLEIEEAVFARVRDGVPGPAGSEDAGYVAGLRAAVAGIVDYAFEGIEEAGEPSGAVPVVAVMQARRAARAGVGLDTVLRRYVAGHALLKDFVLQEVDRGDFVGRKVAVHRVLGTSALQLDRFVFPITRAYGEEVKWPGCSPLGGDGSVSSSYEQSRGQMREVGVALPAMLGNPTARRARECLRFLADHPDSSNHEIVTGIGVTHQPQISRLLSDLTREGIVAKRSAGPGRRNAWRLTPHGEVLARALSGPRD